MQVHIHKLAQARVSSTCSVASGVDKMKARFRWVYFMHLVATCFHMSPEAKLAVPQQKQTHVFSKNPFKVQVKKLIPWQVSGYFYSPAWFAVWSVRPIKLEQNPQSCSHHKTNKIKQLTVCRFALHWKNSNHRRNDTRWSRSKPEGRRSPASNKSSTLYLRENTSCHKCGYSQTWVMTGRKCFFLRRGPGGALGRARPLATSPQCMELPV